jgi:hypothetical protein
MLRSALFFGQNSGSAKMPASIVTVLRVDDDGCLWFFVKRPHNWLFAGEREFPARLDFFKKQVGYFLQITGKALVLSEKDIDMHDWADIPTESGKNVLNELMLMKVKMLNVDYYENIVPQSPHWFIEVAEKVKLWLFANKLGYWPFRLQHKPLHGQGLSW